jgi:hypothetical protein
LAQFDLKSYDGGSDEGAVGGGKESGEVETLVHADLAGIGMAVGIGEWAVQTSPELTPIREQQRVVLRVNQNSARLHRNWHQCVGEHLRLAGSPPPTGER